MPIDVIEKYPNGDPKVTREGVDGHTITKTLDPTGKVTKEEDTSSDSVGTTTKVKTYVPPGTLQKTVTTRTNFASGDETETEEDAAGKPLKKKETKTRPLTPPKKGARNTTTDSVYDPVTKKWRKVKERVVTTETGPDGKPLPEESTETEFDEKGKPKKKAEVKLDKDAAGKVTGRTTTTTEYGGDKPRVEEGKKEKYDPENGTFRMTRVSLVVNFKDEPAPGRRATPRSKAKG